MTKPFKKPSIALPASHVSPIAQQTSPTKGCGFAGRFADTQQITSILVINDPVLTQKLAETAAQIPALNFQPIAQFDETTETAITRDGVILTLKSQLDNLYYFEQEEGPSLSAQKQQSAIVAYFLSQTALERKKLKGAIALDSSACKEHEIVLTKAHLENAKAHLAQHKGQRSPTQTQVMGSPTSKIKKHFFEDELDEAISKLSLPEEQKAVTADCVQTVIQQSSLEYNHSIDFRKLGVEAQKRTNLTVTTDAHNSNQMLAEDIAKRWIEEYGAILLRVHADLIPGTEFAPIIFYSFLAYVNEQQMTSMNFQFSGFATRVPDLKELEYLRLYDAIKRNRPLDKKYRNVLFPPADAPSTSSSEDSALTLLAEATSSYTAAQISVMI